jgi:Uma2 family endonuclease
MPGTSGIETVGNAPAGERGGNRMATILEPTAVAREMVWPVPYQFTVQQYHRMIQHRILREDDPVELLEGWIAKKMPHNPVHDGTVWIIQTAFQPLLAPTWIVRTQSSITTRDSEPEPDIVVARAPGSKYVTSHPTPKDIGLIVEVADSSLETDRGAKARLYARAKIPVYWIVNIPERRLEVYANPRGGKSPMYRQRQIYSMDATVPLVLGMQVIAHLPVQELIPEPETES